MEESGKQGEGVFRPARIIGLAVMMTAAVVATASALVFATEIFLILFLAMLFSVFLNRSSSFAAQKIGVNYGWCLGSVTLILVTTIIGGVFVFGAQIDQQLSGATEQVEEARSQLRLMSETYPTLKSILSSTPVLRDLVATESDEGAEGGTTIGQESKTMGSPGQSMMPESSAIRGDSGIAAATQTAVSALTKIFQTTFGLLVNSVLIFFVGLFLAMSPKTYRSGLVTLFPKSRRDRVSDVLQMMGDSLWNWLIGRFGSMLVTGIGAGILLMGLDVPMAITAGFATGLLTFVPNIGGLLALTLAMLLALPSGLTTVQLVLAGYIVLQLVESYVVTPLIQQKQVSLPPALLIAFQAVMGVLFGFLGAAVASPMLAASKTLVEEIYIKDTLDDV